MPSETSKQEIKRDRIYAILNKLHDVRFDIEMLGMVEGDSELVNLAQNITNMLPIIGERLK